MIESLIILYAGKKITRIQPDPDRKTSGIKLLFPWPVRILCREVETARDGKGNSLFSEVEDRRQKVEWQLKVTSER